MLGPVAAAELLVGVLLIYVAVSDVMLTVALPRSAREGRVSRYVWRLGWWAVTGVARRQPWAPLREALLGGYGPLSVFVVFGIWLLLLSAGFGFVITSLRGSGEPPDLGSVLYTGAAALLSPGYDTGPTLAAKVVGLLAIATALTVFALVITFLFSLFESFRERELEVVSLEATAGAPPSGVAFLVFHAKHGLQDEIGPAFDRWLRWAAAILDSHLAYPILAYFRSSHDNDSWVSSLAAIMDAAILIVTTIEDGPKGDAIKALWVGGHCIDDLSEYFQLKRPGGPGIDLADFREARGRLQRAGYRLLSEDESWEQFKKLRSEHAASLNALADYWASPPAEWVGEKVRRFQHPGGRTRRPSRSAT